MSEAPAVIAMFSGVAEGYEAEANDPTDYIQYVRKDIFDAYKAAVDGYLAFYDESKRDYMVKKYGNIENAATGVHQLMQSARKAGESVK